MVFPAQMPAFVERVLKSFSSSLEQLIYLSSLRNIYSGEYLHEGRDRAAPLVMDPTFSHCHMDVFQGVLSKRVQELCEEIREHFDAQLEEPTQAANFWLENEPFREMIPTGCSPVEREYFTLQFRIALRILARSPDLAVLKERAS